MAQKAGDQQGLAKDGAKATYDRLSNDRSPYLTRAEKNAQYTSPSSFPKGSDDGSTEYKTPYQSVGARGLNNLASKMLLSQMPIGEPFFKLAINEYALKQVQQPEVIQQASIGLSMVERIAMRYMEGAAFRPTIFELMKQLLISGNGLLYLPPGKQSIKLYRLGNFVVERSSTGDVIQLVTKETTAYITLPPEIQNEIGPNDNLTEKIDVYTHVYRDATSGGWLSYQEVEGAVISSTTNSYPEGASPWIPVRLFKVDGEHYGRSFVEEYVGDLVSLENLSESIVQFAQACSKVLFFVNPGGQTSIRRVSKADNGSFVPGRLDDVQVFQMAKYADFQVAKATADGIEQRLSYAFLLNSAVQRQGERVTAEEIRFVANELESTLGGVYSVLSSEFQLPLVQRLLIELQATSKIPQLPKEAVEPTIVTGLDAIGRGQDLQKLQTFVQAGAPAFQFVQGDVNWSNFILRVADAAGIDPTDLPMTPEQRQQKMQQEATNTAAQAAAAAGGQAAGANVGMGATQNQQAMAAAAQQAMGQA